jgi:diguanylate cyclase (GGDEF)-like protein/PAS domain S-box-containing protein
MKENTLKVLLIEDDEDDYILTSDLLEEVKDTHYEIEWIAKYADALAVIQSCRHDVCLIDYRLGEETGTELMRLAKASGCPAPMILLTGQGDQEVDIEATAAGASDYLIKGKIEAPLLERTIRYAVANARMRETLRESESRFRSVVESANDAIVLANSQGEIISWNNGAKVIFGYTLNEISGQRISVLFPSRYYKDSHESDIDPLIALGLLHPGSKAIELKGLKKEGEEFPLEISLSSWETAEGMFYSGIIRDITERKLLENQLTHQALHDPLTKLANRVLFRNRVEHALARVNRNKNPIAVLFLDLDNFKTINDSMGHAAGDMLLVSIAERLVASLRSSDTPARLGGDEFAILVEDATQIGVVISVAERILDVLREPFVIDGKEVFISTSIGVAATITGHETPDELLRNADVAMYMAKNQGKGRHIVFENKMHEAVIKRIELEADMRQAIEREEFTLHYQPIIELQSESIMAIEALVRWNHPQRGLIPPDEFIPLAEETKLILPLGRWILEKACHQAREWQCQYGSESWLSVTVNLSNREFLQKKLVEIVAAALDKSGLSPQCLILEITESVMLQDTEATIEKLQELKSLGVRLAIDDFGTGYSSLSYLQRFPVDILKIDKSFIDRISQSQEGAAVARAIITMSDTLHLRTVAEGIENPEQMAALKNLGCELGQGFHFAKPLNKDDMDDFLNRATLNGNYVGQTNPIPLENISQQSRNLTLP